MSLKQKLTALITDLERFSDEADSETVDTRRLIGILRELRDGPDFQAESHLRRYEKRLEFWTQSKLEMQRAGIAFSQNAMRALFLSNGAAAIALLAFLGAMVDSGQTDLARELSVSLWWFSIGVLLSAFVAMASYVVQFLYNVSIGKASGWGIGFHVIAVVLAIMSLLSFFAGVSLAYGVFRGL